MSRKGVKDNSSSSNDQHKVHQVNSLKKMPFPDLARDVLERLVHATKPLLVRQQWKVGLLTEFYPTNPGLLGLNVNAGYRIMIRLRSPQDRNKFLPWESLLGTMVHELVHNAIGEHSFDFYQMVDRLEKEVQEDMVRLNLAGVNPYQIPNSLPFDWNKSKGRKLGGGQGCGSIQEYMITAARPLPPGSQTKGNQPASDPAHSNTTTTRNNKRNIATNRGNQQASNTNTITTITTTTASSGGRTKINTHSVAWLREQRLLALEKQGVIPIPPTTKINPIPPSSQPSSTSSRPTTHSDTRSSDSINTKDSRPIKADFPHSAQNAVSTIPYHPQETHMSGKKRTRSIDTTVVDLVWDTDQQSGASATTLSRTKKPVVEEIDLVDNDSENICHNSRSGRNHKEYQSQSRQGKEKEEEGCVWLDGDGDGDGSDKRQEDDSDQMWCVPCEPLVIDLVALGLEEE